MTFLGFFLNFLNPDTLFFLIPIVAIIGHYSYKTTKLKIEHEERIARIEAGFEPDCD